MEDVDIVVGYLKSKPAGATLAEAKAVIGSKPLDGRKLSAYKAWGLVTHDAGRIALTEEGRRIGRDMAAKPPILLAVVDRTRPYRSAIEWAHHQGFDTLNVNDLAAHWHEHHSEALGTTVEGSIKDAVTCFFNLAAGAGLGTYMLGRRGTATRMELNKTAVAAFVESGPSEPPWSDADLGDTADFAGESASENSAVENVEPSTVGSDQRIVDVEHRQQRISAARLRVFIAHGQNMRVVEQVQTMLDLADIDAEVAEEEETTAIPVPNKVLTAMRRSDAGIICVSADERRKQEDGTYTINDNVLIEIGAAFVLYDTRVILLWDKRLPVPSNLQGLYRCEFEGEEIGWNAGMKLMKAVSAFRQV